MLPYVREGDGRGTEGLQPAQRTGWQERRPELRATKNEIGGVRTGVIGTTRYRLNSRMKWEGKCKDTKRGPEAMQ